MEEHPRPTEYYRALPKVDLHRHLEGSLRLHTMSEVSRQFSLGLPKTNQLRNLVQVNEQESYTFENFLSKFETLRLFYRSPEIISRITHEAIEDAAADGIRYLELRFTPAALSRAEKFSLGEVMDWVIAGVQQAHPVTEIETRLIVSVNRHESLQLATEAVAEAVDRKNRGVVGVDLAGNEAHFSALPFAGLFREAQQAGLHVTVHAGEWGRGANVAEAIEQLGAERIGHGIRVLEDARAVSLARERGTVFEVCLTSNYQSGAVPALSNHPLVRMLHNGLRVTLNSDDPSISRILLSNEYRLACDQLGLPEPQLFDLILCAAQSAFLPLEEKAALVTQMESLLQHK